MNPVTFFENQEYFVISKQTEKLVWAQVNPNIIVRAAFSVILRKPSSFVQHKLQYQCS